MVQITVTTTGTTSYGQTVINLLDPNHQLFKILVGRERQMLAYEVVDVKFTEINDPVLAKAMLKRFNQKAPYLDLCFAFDDNCRVWR